MGSNFLINRIRVFIDDMIIAAKTIVSVSASDIEDKFKPVIKQGLFAVRAEGAGDLLKHRGCYIGVYEAVDGMVSRFNVVPEPLGRRKEPCCPFKKEITVITDERMEFLLEFKKNRH